MPRVSSLTSRAASTLKDPAMQGRWFLFIPETANSAGGLNVGLREVLAEHVVSPFHKTPARPRFTKGTNWHYPDFADLDSLQMIFYENYEFDTTRWLFEWRREVFDPDTGEYGLPSLYRRNFNLEFYPPNSDEPMLTKTFEGCFPTEQNAFELNYTENDGRLTVPAQFAVRKLGLS